MLDKFLCSAEPLLIYEHHSPRPQLLIGLVNLPSKLCESYPDVVGCLDILRPERPDGRPLATGRQALSFVRSNAIVE